MKAEDLIYAPIHRRPAEPEKFYEIYLRKFGIPSVGHSDIYTRAEADAIVHTAPDIYVAMPVSAEEEDE